MFRWTFRTLRFVRARCCPVWQQRKAKPKPGWWKVEEGALIAESTSDKPCQECNYLMCQFTDRDAKQAASKGIIALQMHPGPPMKIEFKNIRLKEL
ncbi:MAG TPA: hypothetical protein PKM43_21990 [Verrucomicrobiota bacterium]|nr:hypothetical protein [Verrucomicrobiota bacterium]